MVEKGAVGSRKGSVDLVAGNESGAKLLASWCWGQSEDASPVDVDGVATLDFDVPIG
jgi:hypothetical protein